MNLIGVEAQNFEAYKNNLVSLYIDTFSSGKSFQYHSEEETAAYLQSIFNVGYGVFAMEENKIVGAILLTPLSFDRRLPEEIAREYAINRSVYVAEMMVEKSKQGQGIGKKLLNHFLENADRNKYNHAFIRVWIENETAVSLYKKMGFEICAKLVQPKLLADKSAIFDFEKVYLQQRLC
ncbi:GNAT family N-acetyltransferase [Draconibacterium halophilum]|uniref:GNAT family N-acetyltransferase n=1 Tax=Draconibacterium halophilum TaxID=2706887 RepID=A0A6C0RB42_9BACT|nr:GNAT family N-acetyltransferase [Draconibacterium halophilum]QIA07858.1 GNAT family N-acetyltransferase [Draconibacterium halophilum]